MVKHIAQDSFKEEVLDNSGVVVVDFYADWCGPCKMLAPVLEEIEAEMDGKVKIVKVNVDENNELSNEYQITNIPALKIFKAGSVVDTQVGFKPKPILVDVIKEAL
ncbi:MAG: thioredoxin [Clostridium sp.]|nr:thioredoxin [Clostridium sp.]